MNPTKEGAPAPIPDMEGLTPRNEARLICWTIRARLHGSGWYPLAAVTIAITAAGAWITRPLGSGPAWTTAALVLITFPLAFLVLIAAVQLLTNANRRRRGWLVGYFTNDATQLIHPNTAGQWILSDHVARSRGHGLAAPFRRQVFAHLAAEANRLHIVIFMSTHSEKLAQLYICDMPELRITAQHRTINGRTWILQRNPKPTDT